MPLNESENKNIALMVTGFFGIIFTSICIVALFSMNVPETQTPDVAMPLHPKVQAPDPFLGIALDAQSAFVLDTITGKILFSKNSEAQLPLASITKVMTALIASDAPKDMEVSVRASDLSLGSGGLKLFEKWNLQKLINYTLVISSNSGANVIAGAIGSMVQKNEGLQNTSSREIFLRLMNEKAKELGLHQTFYLNPSGLDVSVEGDLSGAYGSASDMALLFSYIVKNKPALLQMTAYDSLQFASADGALHRADNTNLIAHTIPGLIASKTGLTDLAHGNLVIVFDVGPLHPVVAVVLGSTEKGRFRDIEKLVKATILKVGEE